MPAADSRTLTPREIAGIALAVGFSGKALETAVAVALGESSGQPAKKGDLLLQTSKWGPSVGLWQIRSLKAERGKGTERDETRLTDPSYNAASAFKISNGGRDWSPWTVYTARTYLLHLPAAKRGVKDNGGSVIATGTAGTAPPGTNLPGVPDVIEDIYDQAQALGTLVAYPGKVLAWITDRNNVFRLVKVTAGFGLVFIGLAIVARPVQKQAVAVAGKVAGVAMKAKGGKV